MPTPDEKLKIEQIGKGARLWSDANWGGCIKAGKIWDEVIAGKTKQQYSFHFKGCTSKNAAGAPDALRLVDPRRLVEGETLFSGYDRLYRATLVDGEDGKEKTDGGKGLIEKAKANQKLIQEFLQKSKLTTEYIVTT